MCRLFFFLFFSFLNPPLWGIIVLKCDIFPRQGINRVKSSSDVVGALMKELRQQSGQPGCDFHLAVAVDGVNALWGKSSIQKEDKSEVSKSK